MGTALSPLPRSGAEWLHSVATPYFAELAPDLAPPNPDHFDIWWGSPHRAIHLINTDGHRTGFAMIRRTADHQHELSEFCILPGARGKGIGTAAAALCFARHPGRWCVGVAAALPGTARFWDRLLPRLPGIEGLARGPALTPYQCHSYSFDVQDMP